MASPTPIPVAPHAFRDAQIANARLALSELDIDSLDERSGAQVRKALAALTAAPTGERSSIPMDVGVRAQEVAEAHLDAVNEAFFAEQEGDETVESPAYGPYCGGCDTCTVREVLAAAWPVFEADAAVRALTA